jgi:hypothetical protein
MGHGQGTMAGRSRGAAAGVPTRDAGAVESIRAATELPVLDGLAGDGAGVWWTQATAVIAAKPRGTRSIMGPHPRDETAAEYEILYPICNRRLRGRSHDP